MDNAPFSPESDEQWAEISDFPDYAVSNTGKVTRYGSKRMITPTSKPGGLRMVGLMRDGVQYKRSLALLVATAFVPPHPFKHFDTPIHLNGDRAFNHFSNLMWRPLPFARAYNKQFTDDHVTLDCMIEDVETHIRYKNSMSAAIHHGLLDTDIVVSMANNTYVWPTGQIFREAYEN